MRQFLLHTLILLGAILPTLSSAGEIKSLGDDLFPWPWGTECPFPWKEIEGQYTIQSDSPEIFSGNNLVFDVVKQGRDDLKFLKITQFDSRGILYASGDGYSQKDQRIVKGILRVENSNYEYYIIVRSYVKDKRNNCDSGQLVTAVTFSPLHGKPCMDSSYVLEKR
ncbi:MAG: hypothetical protein A2Z20_12325 [Bdellovibrionales bacterium RBG_16_40_8]|nr:MAG: hypothetical protein A2Z20_12325 [Bdellovibrionales bacterium RBG_16_40_8]